MQLVGARTGMEAQAAHIQSGALNSLSVVPFLGLYFLRSPTWQLRRVACCFTEGWMVPSFAAFPPENLWAPVPTLAPFSNAQRSALCPLQHTPVCGPLSSCIILPGRSPSFSSGSLPWEYEHVNSFLTPPLHPDVPLWLQPVFLPIHQGQILRRLVSTSCLHFLLSHSLLDAQQSELAHNQPTFTSGLLVASTTRCHSLTFRDFPEAQGWEYRVLGRCWHLCWVDVDQPRYLESPSSLGCPARSAPSLPTPIPFPRVLS